MTLAEIPGNARQVVLVTGQGKDSPKSQVVLYRRTGAGKGGGIWLHVDHGGPTHGCVSLAQDHMKELLRTLDPAQHPVIVMGDAESLAR